jgi:hypothetical protein
MNGAQLRTKDMFSPSSPSNSDVEEEEVTTEYAEEHRTEKIPSGEILCSF